MADLSISRDEYEGESLDADAIGADPLAAIASWVEAAEAAGEPQPNAMNLATVDAAGSPSVRTVLLKGVDTGLLFFTNYTSAKAVDLAANPKAAVNLTWLNTHRQIRATGRVTKLFPEESDAYFAGRPRGSQIAAIASDQSSPLADRTALESAFTAIAEQHDGPIPRPAYWGGYRLLPDRVEFWHGRRNRMHDRIQYTRTPDGWAIQRLAP